MADRVLRDQIPLLGRHTHAEDESTLTHDHWIDSPSVVLAWDGEKYLTPDHSHLTWSSLGDIPFTTGRVARWEVCCLIVYYQADDGSEIMQV